MKRRIVRSTIFWVILSIISLSSSMTTLAQGLDVPQLTAPIPNAPNVAGNTFFTWSSVTNATAYRIEISQTNNFSTSLTSQTTASLSLQAASTIPGGLASGETYYWRARAENSSTQSSWSIVYQFTAAGIGITEPTIISSYCQGQQLNVFWTAPNATNFTISLSTNNGISFPIVLWDDWTYNGGFFWTITNDITSTQCIVRVTDKRNGAFGDSPIFPILVPASIASQPTSSIICFGNSTTLSVTALGSNVTYQWFRNSLPIANETAASVVVSQAGNYTCEVRANCESVATSQVAQITVVSAPTITVQPISQNICLGENVTFSITAISTYSTSELAYQWKKNGIALPNQTSATLFISQATTQDIAQYICEVSENFCNFSVTSTSVSLSVSIPPQLTLQPQRISACEGVSTSLTVAANGENLSYQWRKNGVNISGATFPTLQFPTLAISDAGNYECIVRGKCSFEVTSQSVSISVQERPRILQQPFSKAVCEGSAVTFSLQTTPNALGYQWLKDGNILSGQTSTTLTISSVSSSDVGLYECLVLSSCPPALYSSAASLSIIAPARILENPVSKIACTGSNVTFLCSATGDSLRFQWKKNGDDILGATASILQLVNVTSADDGEYNVEISNPCTSPLQSSYAALRTSSRLVVLEEPETQFLCPGETLTLTARATGANVSYQWFTSTGAIIGATNSMYRVLQVTESDEANYYCRITSDCGTAFTRTAAVGIGRPARITKQPEPVTVCIGKPAFFSVEATGTELQYFWFKNNDFIGNASTATFTIQSVTQKDTGSYFVVIQSACPEIVQSQAVRLTVDKNSPKIVFGPESQKVCVGGTAIFQVQASGENLRFSWRKNGQIINSGSDGIFRLENVQPDQAGKYDVVVDVIVSGACEPADTSFAATLTILQPPTISSSPKDTTVCDGATAIFRASATGDSISYQWYKNGIVLPGQTNPTLIIPAVSPTDQGQYAVKVVGTCPPETISRSAVLFVKPKPIITQQPQPIIVVQDSVAVFRVIANGTGLTYQWLKNGGIIAGATSSELRFDKTDTTDAGIYSVIVRGECGEVLSDTARLRVLVPESRVRIAFSQDFVTFDNSCVGEQRLRSFPSLVWNLSSSQIRISKITISGPDSSAFTASFASQLPRTLGRLQGDSLRISFTAQRIGIHRAQLVLTSDSGISEKLLLFGQGSTLSFSVFPLDLNFGTTSGMNGVTRSSMLYNPNSCRAFVDSVVLSTDITSQFKVTSPASFPASISPLDSLQLSIEFRTNSGDPSGRYQGEAYVYFRGEATPFLLTLDARTSQIFTSISDETHQFISIFPNPADDEIFVSFSENIRVSSVVITNVLGNVVYQGNIPSSQKFLLRDLPNGVYVFTAITGTERISRNFTIIR